MTEAETNGESTNFAPDLQTVLAHRCVEERNKRGWSASELALRSGLSTTHISRIEGGTRQASLAALSRLAAAFGIPAAELVSSDVSDMAYAAKVKSGAVINVSGLSYETLISLPFAPMDAFRVSIEAGRTRTSWRSHSGIEWIYVLEGSMELRVGRETFVVHASEAACFKATERHKLCNTSKERCVALVFILPSSEFATSSSGRAGHEWHEG